MIISISKIARELKVSSPDLITRPMGRNFYRKVSSRLSIVQESETVVLDFEGIRVVDSSFIAEFIMAIMFDSRSGPHHFFIKLISLSDTAIMNIESVFKTYSSQNNRKLAVITDTLINDSYCIGSVSETGKDVINYLNINKTATIDELSSFLEKDLQSTGNLLEELYQAGIVKMQQGQTSSLYCSL